MKKKKISLKEEREKNKSARISNRKTNSTLQQQENERPKTTIQDSKKTKAKAAGIKSTFVVDDKIVITSFGRGNDARPEFQIIDKKEQCFNSDNSLHLKNVDVKNGILFIESNRVSEEQKAFDPTHVDSEYKLSKGYDIIGSKDLLEKRFFGKTFDDNIHIQIIYNILDIEKVLSASTTDAVYSLNNITRENDDDFIGVLYLDKTFEEFISTNTKDKDKIKINKFNNFTQSPRLCYFGNAFYKKNGTDIYKRCDKEIYHIITLISGIRQFCIHDLEEKENNQHGVTRTWLYNIEKTIPEEYFCTLDTIFKDETNELDIDFVEKNKISILILEDVLVKLNIHKSLEHTIEEYYRFVIEKSYLNIGFSIKQLREKIIEKAIKDSCDNNTIITHRKKINKLLDFVIFSLYTEEQIDRNVKILRTCLDENEKEKKFYEPESEELWKKHKDIFKKNIINLFEDQTAFDNYSKNTLESNEISEKLKISNRKVSYFTKLLYLLTMFLDGKEINDLLTSLINKFDNIRSLLEILDSVSSFDKCSFTENYKFFEQGSKICSEIRMINGFAHMQKPVYELAYESFDHCLDSLSSSDKKEILLEIVKNQDNIKNNVDSISESELNRALKKEIILRHKLSDTGKMEKGLLRELFTENVTMSNDQDNEIVDDTEKKYFEIIEELSVNSKRQMLSSSLNDVVSDKIKSFDFDKKENYILFKEIVNLCNEQAIADKYIPEKTKEIYRNNIVCSKELIEDAINILGSNHISPNDRETFINNTLRIDKNELYTNRTAKKYVSFQNFLSNNIISSKKFNYLIRYADARNVSELAHNEKVIEFVLNTIEKNTTIDGDNSKPNQIAKYFDACFPDKNSNDYSDIQRKKMLKELIMKIDCKYFIIDKNVTTANALKAVSGLYLTVLYQIVKNMMYVNSRYVIAFHCLERDSVLNGIEKINEKKRYNELTTMILNSTDKKYALVRNIRASKYIKENMENRISKNKENVFFIKDFRNSVAHMNTIKKLNEYIDDVSSIRSYFELYHYAMQNYLINNNPNESNYYFDIIREKKWYCKDLVKTLNTPFGYNLARYKNLSIAELFDRNAVSEIRKYRQKHGLNRLTNEELKMEYYSKSQK